MHHKVLGIGDSFSFKASSNSNRKPVLFEWTDDPSEATVDTIVCLQAGILKGIDTPGRKIGWLNESPAITKWQNIHGIIHSELDRYMDAYEFILTSDRAECATHPRFVYHPAGSNLPWIPEDKYEIYQKSKLCSMIASDKKMVPGHLYRLQVAEKLKNRLDLFGGACGSRRIGGQGSHPDKSEGLIDYCFHIAMENCQVPFYYTERLTDCFAVGAVPIYWGADCIGEICNPEGVISLDDNFEIGMLNEALYQSMLPAIRENFEIVKQLESADDLLFRRYIKSGLTLPVSTTRRQPESVTSPHNSHDKLLQVVTQKEKRTITSLTEVPAEYLSTYKITTSMQPPRSIRHDVENFEWFPQLDKSFLLRLPDGFIGDNVVFDSERYYSFGRWWMGDNWRLYKETETIRHIDAGISIAAWGGESFQHFITDAVPALAGMINLLESARFEHVNIVSHCQGSPMAQWFWRKLGLTDRIVQKPVNAKEGFVIHADEVLYSQYMPTLGELGLFPRHILRPVQRRLGLLHPLPQDRIIYLQRPDYFPRRVSNEHELLSRVKQELVGTGLELEVFVGPKQEIQEDMDRFRRARIIFGPHGGAMSNIVFAQPGSHVIEFLPIYKLYREGSDSRAMFWGLAQAAGLEYWTVEPGNFEFEERQGMLVDVEEVAAIVRHILHP